MKAERIKEILKSIADIKVAVYGDFCLDAYWIMDPAGSEISLETGKKAEAVRRHYYSPGGASNITANLSALKPLEIRAIGVIGNDIFGRELVAQLRLLGVDVNSLVVQEQDFDTYTFTKKYLEEEEEPRIDFGLFNIRSSETDTLIINHIRKALIECDALIFNQQFPGSISNPDFIEQANALFREFDNKIILLDSRHYNDQFKNVYRKTNSIEIARMCGVISKPHEIIPVKDVIGFANDIFKQSGKSLFVTCGERGIIALDHEGVHEISGIQFLKRLDTVGAGDTTISALALCLATGIPAFEAAQFSNLAAAVTIQKLFTTGTASGEEIISISTDPDLIFNPDLAEHPEEAIYMAYSNIELCDSNLSAIKSMIKHVVFDHDGTISTLRHGWEQVMEKVMIDAIIGDAPFERVKKLIPRISERVKSYIEKSTGIQTISQMEGLAEMVKEFNLVRPSDRKEKTGYKKIYNQALLDNIKDRLRAVRENLFARDEFIIAGALEFLNELKNRKIKLYLASGTDKEYVENEASILGYAELFDGGIYGALDDVSKYSKKMVFRNIINENHLSGEELIVFGDGPVEIREIRKQGGIAIGVASDEDRMEGINYKKRSRLIKAGAQMIIQDFREYEKLLDLFFK